MHVHSDQEIIGECLRATVEGPFFPDWEFHTLFGLTRDEVREVLDLWPATDDPDVQRLAVNNSLNSLLGYPINNPSAWSDYVSVPPEEVAEVLARWRGDDGFDGSPRGYFDRSM